MIISANSWRKSLSYSVERDGVVEIAIADAIERSAGNIAATRAN